MSRLDQFLEVCRQRKARVDKGWNIAVVSRIVDQDLPQLVDLTELLDRTLDNLEAAIKDRTISMEAGRIIDEARAIVERSIQDADLKRWGSYEPKTTQGARCPQNQGKQHVEKSDSRSDESFNQPGGRTP